MTKWTPKPSDLAWCRNLVRIMKDGAIWGCNNGVYRIDKKGNTLTLLLRADDFSLEDHERKIVAFGAIGYTVKEKDQ